MTTCWRCGVEFDGSAFPSTFPCIDCQEALPKPDPVYDERTGHKKRGKYTLAELAEQRVLQGIKIRSLWVRGLSDPEISAQLGVSSQTVLRYRKANGMEANARNGRVRITPEQKQKMLDGYFRWQKKQRTEVAPDTFLYYGGIIGKMNLYGREIHMEIKITEPMKNLRRVTLGEREVWFSYETPVAFKTSGYVTISDNDWGVRTGAHLNHIAREYNVSKRVPHADVLEIIGSVLGEI